MNELIKVTKSEGGRDVVSARALHEFLEIETRFDTWVVRMIDYGFTVGVDCSKLSIENQMVDWALTIDCAKHWSMIQRTDKGMIARNYFIECEKQLKQVSQLPDFNNPAIAARAWADEFEKRQLAEKQIKQLEPKVAVFEQVMSSESCVDLGQAAKVLNIGIGRNRLFESLRDGNVLTASNIPYQTYIDRGYFKCIETPYMIGEKTYVHVKTLVTQKGIEWLVKTLKHE